MASCCGDVIDATCENKGHTAEEAGNASILKSYKILKCIGQCSAFGKVLLASRNHGLSQTSSLVIIKKYSLENYFDDWSLIKEVWLMKQLRHPNLLHCLDSFIVGHSLCIVTPLMDHGSALDLIHSNFSNGLPELVIAGILRDVLQALIYLHSKGYIHRSVRASHILISSKGQVVLTGIHNAYCLIEKGRWQRAVFDYPCDTEYSLCWLSPELLEQNLRGYNEKTDIYSLGITACELANGVSPFVDLTSTQLLITKLHGPLPQLWDCTTIPCQEKFNSSNSNAGVVMFDGVAAPNHIHSRLESAYQRNFTRSFHRFAKLCVQREPSLRPGAAQLLKHPFIQSLRKGSTLNWIDFLSGIQPTGKVLDELPCEITGDSSEHFDEVEATFWDFSAGDTPF